MPNFTLLATILFEIWIIIKSDFWSSDRQTENDAQEPTVQIAQVGSKIQDRGLRPTPVPLTMSWTFPVVTFDL